MSRKHHDKHDESDPIAEYKQWSDHRYTPGYFTGGRLPPTVRALQQSLTRKEKRAILVVILVGLVVAIVAQVWVWFR